MDDYYNLYILEEDIPDDPDFVVPYETTCKDIKGLFKSVAFQNQNLPEEATPKLTVTDNQWITAKVLDPDLTVPAPSVAAERAAERHLKNSIGHPYDFVMPVAQEQWQNFVMYRYYQLAADPDPKISKPALDSLAKTNIVNLTAERTEVNINMKSTVELDNYLMEALNKYAGKTIEGEAVRV